MAVVQRPNLVRNLLLAMGIILLVIAGSSYFKNRKVEPEPTSLPEEIIVQEEGAVKKTDEGEQVLSEEEVRQLREEVDGVLSAGGKTASLNDIVDTGARGEAKTAFSDGKFYCKMTASGLKAVEKGYYYEGWLKNEDNLSIGRMEVNLFGEGVLYYTASIDRSDYGKVVLTLEPEDGDPEPGKAVLEGSF